MKKEGDFKTSRLKEEMEVRSLCHDCNNRKKKNKDVDELEEQCLMKRLHFGRVKELLRSGYTGIIWKIAGVH